MNPDDLNLLLSGAISLGYLVVALFFTRFWRLTRDRLFACFAASFFILAVERALLLTIGPASDYRPAIYLTRLAAFVTIIVAIWDKNRQKR